MAGKTSAKPAKTTKKAAGKRLEKKAAATSTNNSNASKQNNKTAANTGDWRTNRIAEIRSLIRQADPDAVEEVKWRKPSNEMQGVPTWSHDGLICTGETYKQYVKLTFAYGAALKDPSGLFNASLEGNTRRAIDIREGDKLNKPAFKALFREAVAYNTSRSALKHKPAAPNKPVLLAGGNPQIAKADGDAPVQAYIAAMPDWKSEVGRRLDALIERNVPNVRKAVRWNSPFYGVEGQGWFLDFHCFTKYIKVAFFRGTLLNPVPPGKSTHKEVRYLDIFENRPLDEVQLAAWIRQAAALPGWEP